MRMMTGDRRGEARESATCFFDSDASRIVQLAGFPPLLGLFLCLGDRDADRLSLAHCLA